MIDIERLAVGGSKSEGRVAYDVRLKISAVAYNVASASAIAYQSKHTVTPLVLKNIYCVSDTHYCSSWLKQILVGYAVVLMERAAEAGVNYNHRHVGPIAVSIEIFKMQVGCSFC